MPMKFLDNHYYVIQRKDIGEPFVAKYVNDNFRGSYEFHSESSVKVISGPFSIDQLTKLNPVVQ
jgi:hypothetical protein